MTTRTALRLASVLGVSGVAVYVGTTVLGGVLDPTYSHASHTISELTGAGAPNRDLLAALYITYNLLLVGFGYALHRAMPHEQLLRIGMHLFILSGVAGVLMVTAFPTDLPGAVPTAIGRGHIAIAGVASALIVAATFVLGFAFRRVDALRFLAPGSFIAGAAIVVSGPLTAFAVAANSPFEGVFERITIGLFLLWVWGISMYMLLEVPVHGTFDARTRAIRL